MLIKFDILILIKNLMKINPMNLINHAQPKR